MEVFSVRRADQTAINERPAHTGVTLYERALVVEMEGFEPSSKHGTKLLSTRLALIGFSTRDEGQSNRLPRLVY